MITVKKFLHYHHQFFFIQPFMDRKAGNVETWPASKDTATAQAKPKLLQKLENYLQKELKALGCQNDTKPSEKRMQVEKFVHFFLKFF